MRPTQRRVLSAVTLLLLTALGGRSAGAQTTVRVSVASDGTEGNAASLGAAAVVVHDRQTGTTERVSVASDGTEGNAASAGATLSADGRFVAFHSAATNLVAGDMNGTNDVFVHDRQTGITERVSVASDGTQGNNASSYPAFSADGRFVAFDSDATDLVAGDTNGTTDVFVHDRQTGTTERVSVVSGGAPQGNGTSGGFFAF